MIELTPEHESLIRVAVRETLLSMGLDVSSPAEVKELQADDPVGKIGTQNNVVFAGSTSELMKLLGKKDDNIIDQ